MIFDVRSENIARQLGNTFPGETPIAIVARYISENHARKPSPGVEINDSGVWHVLNDTLPKDSDKIQWSTDRAGTHVAIPMYKYVLTEQDSSVLVRFGTNLGLLVYHLSASKHPLERVLIVISNIFAREDNQEGYTVYVGVAVKEEPK